MLAICNSANACDPKSRTSTGPEYDTRERAASVSRERWSVGVGFEVLLDRVSASQKIDLIQLHCILREHTMETEVIPISDAFVNEEEVVHCGILICCQHDPGHPDRPVLLVPRIRRQGRSVAASCEYDGFSDIGTVFINDAQY